MKIKVKVRPGSSCEKVEEKEGMLVVWVREPAKQGRANRAVAKLLAKYFGVEASRVRLVSGFTSALKIFEII